MSHLTSARMIVVDALRTVDGLTVRDSLPDATPSEALAVVMLERSEPDVTGCVLATTIRVLLAVPQTEPGVADAALELWHDPCLDALPESVEWNSTTRTVYRDSTPCLDLSLTVRS
jgi:hypothetical protein